MSALNMARMTTLFAYFGLFTLTLLWVTVFSPSPRLPVSLMLLVFVGPLLLPLRGLLHARASTHVWTSMLVLLYFIHGIVEAWASPTERWLAMTEVLLSIALFAGCFYYVQLSKQQNNNS
jgi:uncharacterized membrane protein